VASGNGIFFLHICPLPNYPNQSLSMIHSPVSVLFPIMAGTALTLLSAAAAACGREPAMPSPPQHCENRWQASAFSKR
jgi:hypothetical protein